MAQNYSEDAKRLFEAALNREPSTRADFLEGAYITNPTLRREVEALFDDHVDRTSFFDTPVADAGRGSNPRPAPNAGSGDSAISAPQSAGHPDRIGPYRVLQKLGEGGMGVVYEAEQTEPVRRKVALKLVKWGMDTKEVIARFESERQALALMNHPNIASVFDAGATAQGRPYFAMELVRGEPITKHCDKHRDTVGKRLDLFFQVCDGVQHAHQNGIIHRDLKPSNILVTIHDQNPVPKIIDFGVAKATSQRLTERTMYTQLGQLIGTPEYMSPEQAEMGGQSIDTRTDVYALGVVLYQLLVGALPFDSNELRGVSYDEVRRRIREDDPPRPSTRFNTLGTRSTHSAKNRSTQVPALARQLKGDLDWIVLKALEKSRMRRYGSPAELAADLRRYLNHEPVLASPPSAMYRARKFVRRHRVGVAFTALLFAALVAVAGTMTIQAGRVTRERDRANREAQLSNTALDFVVDLFNVSDPGEARGNSVTAREILDHGAAKIDAAFADQPEVQARLLGTIGVVYQSLGLYETAEKPLQAALGIRRRELGNEHSDVADALEELGAVVRRRAQYKEAEEYHREALAIRQKLHRDEHVDVASSLRSVGLALHDQGDYAAAEPLYAQALDMARRLLPDDSREELAKYTNGMANLLADMGKPVEAEKLFRETLELRRRVFGAKHPEVAFSIDNLAMILHDQGNYEAAEPLYREALALLREIYGAEHPEVAQTLGNFSFFLVDKGDFQAAEAMMREALAIDRKLFEPDHPRIADGLSDVADLMYRQGKSADAEALIRDALQIYRARFPPGHMNIVNCESIYGAILGALGRPDEAEPLLVESFAAMQRIEERAPERLRALTRVIDFYEVYEKPEKVAEYVALRDGATP